MDCAALEVPTSCVPKFRMFGERLATGAVPVPVTDALWGLSLASSVTARVADRAPVAVGVKVAVMVQLDCTASELAQLLIWLKSALFAPTRPTLEMFSVLPPPLTNVTVRGKLLVPTIWSGNAKTATDKLTPL